MDQFAAAEHASELASFQAGGDPRFLWGHDQRTGGLFHLSEGQAESFRDYVTGNVVCPVPACGAALTTVHSSVKRDHLRHRAGAGGHGLESLFHAQGCALVEAWLRERYPLCRVRREEYTSADGESRADVLVTSPDGGRRVAFEVQYSPLTADAWTDRHERYVARGVHDVWLFGHTSKQLKLDGAGRLRLKPAQVAAAATGAPLLFINPDLQQIAVAVEQQHPFSAAAGAYLAEHQVDVLGRGDGSALEVHPIASFRLGVPAMTSDRVEALLANAASLAQYNDQQRRLFALEQARRAERDRQQRAADAARSERTRRQREQQAEQIRRTLSVPSPWGVDHPVVPLLHRYLDGHRDRNLGWHDGAPERWKCVAFFHQIASNQSDVFGPPQVASTLRAHGLRLDTGIYKVIALWLRQLVADGFLNIELGQDGHARYRPTFRGTWW